MNPTNNRTYWNGYRTMKRLAYDYCNADKAFMEIYNSNSSDMFVRGARRAYEFIKRVGVQNITA